MARNTSSNELRRFLLSLGVHVDPTLHINGHHFHSAIVVVDFGMPLRPVKLTADQLQELSSRMRKLTRELIGNRDLNIRVSNDYQHGVYWTSIS